MTTASLVTPAFDAEAHVYTIDGIGPVVSVTQAIHAAGLIDTTRYTDTGRDRGTLVHLMTELHDTDDLDIESLDPALVPYWEAYRRFLSELQPRVTWSHIEQRLADHARRFAGTIDRLGQWDGRDLVLDIKSGGRESWHGVQTWAYAELCESNGLVVSARRARRAALYLAGDGTYRLDEHTDTTNDRAAWQAALTLAQWKRSHA